MEDTVLVEMRKCFLIEAAELIVEVESTFLELESDPSNKEHIQHIFRVYHNIKGSSAAVGLEALSKFTHQIENLLSKIIQELIAVNGEVVDILLASNDRLKIMFSLCQDSLDGQIIFPDNSDITSEIQVILQGSGEKSAPEVVPASLENQCAKQIDISDFVNEDGSFKEENHEEIIEEKPERSEKQEKHDKKQDEYIRLPLSKVDGLLDALGEQAILNTILDQGRMNLSANGEMIEKTIVQLSKITYHLQQTALSLRMFNLNTIFSKMKRIVRDTAKQLNKEVNFITQGEALEVDKTILDELDSPLVHLIRNAIDHGIEPAAIRKEMGKKPEGTIKLSASTHGGFLYIEIVDDGNGLNKEKILKRAIEKKIITPEQSLNDKEIYQLIFKSDFSTKEQVSELSGRGVGMNVVKNFVDKFRGSIDIKTEEAKGTNYIIKLPLSLGIFNGMIVLIDDGKFIIPNADVKEIVQIASDTCHRVDEQEKIIDIKGRVMPLIDIKSLLLGVCDKTEGNVLAIIIEHHGREYALRIHDILGQQKIVFKNLGSELKHRPGFSGGTILADGKAALILDVASIIRLYQGVST
ncbi:MAG: chemotaxis protein CheA [Oligoflexia bacterium]|nr:chemotaxis protein CheA [Oligoflexia bacterium]MBF0366760.1 chemotaxis protein CheA [Oligoflexia bacterium]